MDPSVRCCPQAVAAGEVGRLERLTITSRDPPPAPAAYITACGGVLPGHEHPPTWTSPGALFRLRQGHRARRERLLRLHGLAEEGELDSAVTLPCAAETGHSSASPTPGTAPTGYLEPRLEASSAARACCTRTTFHGPPRFAGFGPLGVEGADPSRPVLPGAISISVQARAGPLRRHHPRRQPPLSPGFEDGIAVARPCRRRSPVGRDR